jgi:hypothetical protein
VNNTHPDFADTQKLIANCGALIEKLQSENDPLQEDVLTSMRNLINILQNTDSSLSAEDFSDIGELGLTLLRSLFYKAQGDEQQLFNEVSVAFAYWLARHNAVIQQIDFTVNAIAVLANTYHDKVSLESLYEACSFIIPAISEDLKAPANSLNPSDPWRLLNLNYAIISTRTHTPELMESAFKTLLTNFPDDANNFFKQGMNEMERLNYPSHVRVVMQRYFDQYSEV